MVISRVDKVAIKFLRENKCYGAKRLLAVCPSKQWLLSQLKRLTYMLNCWLIFWIWLC